MDPIKDHLICNLLHKQFIWIKSCMFSETVICAVHVIWRLSSNLGWLADWRANFQPVFSLCAYYKIMFLTGSLLAKSWGIEPVFCLLLGVSSSCAQPITGQVTSVTRPVIRWATDRKRALVIHRKWINFLSINSSPPGQNGRHFGRW